MNNTAHEIYEEASKIWNPGKVNTFRAAGIELSMGKRHGNVFEDIEGHQFINMHSNGGVFNLGHTNDEIREALIKGSQIVDAGNHYFPSQYKNQLCSSLLSVSPSTMQYVFPLNGGGEAIDAAVKFARRATQRKRCISLTCAFHGGTGISMQAGSDDMAAFFNMKPDPEIYTKVTYNDLNQLEDVLKKNDTACVLIETIPATAGFPMPVKDYHKNVEILAHKYGALYIADEVQTGLMRSGKMWCCCKYGANPDIIVTGKGLSGGYYPMSAVIMNENAGKWMKEDGFAHVSSFNGTELGCIVASKVIEILKRPSTKQNIDMLTNIFEKGLEILQKKYSGFVKEIRQCGVIMGIKTTDPMGGFMLMKSLLKNGVWTVYADFDKSVLQFKPGLLMTEDTAQSVLLRLDKALGEIPYGKRK